MNPYGPTGPWAGQTDISGMYPTEPVVRMPAPEIERSMARPMGASGSVPNPLGVLTDLIGIGMPALWANQLPHERMFDLADYINQRKMLGVTDLPRNYQTFMGG